MGRTYVENMLVITDACDESERPFGRSRFVRTRKYSLQYSESIQGAYSV